MSRAMTTRRWANDAKGNFELFERAALYNKITLFLYLVAIRTVDPYADENVYDYDMVYIPATSAYYVIGGYSGGRLSEDLAQIAS